MNTPTNEYEAVEWVNGDEHWWYVNWRFTDTEGILRRETIAEALPEDAMDLAEKLNSIASHLTGPLAPPQQRRLQLAV
jgi:hypothetical protein